MISIRGVVACLAFGCLSIALGTEPTKSKPVTKEPTPNLEFLEYLGTLEHGEENWTDVVNVELPRAEKAKTVPKAKAKSEPAKDVGGEK